MSSEEEKDYRTKNGDRRIATESLRTKHQWVVTGISSVVTFMGSVIWMMNLVIAPLKDQVAALSAAQMINQSNILDVTKRIGTKPRALPLVTKLQGRFDSMHQRVDRLENKIDRLYSATQRNSGYFIKPSLRLDELYVSEEIRDE